MTSTHHPRKQLLIANWKMNLLAEDALVLAEKFDGVAEALPHIDVWIAPSYLAIPLLALKLKESRVKFGAQNVCGFEKGAYTGEVSPGMLLDFECEFALVGHSERRHTFGESDAQVIERAKGALKAGLKVVFCIGETAAQFDAQETKSVLIGQLVPFLKSITPEEATQVVIAYEPCWAIGTGVTPSPTIIHDTHSVIKGMCVMQEREVAGILYGGSVTPENAQEILSLPNVDGALIGGASLSVEKFEPIARVADGIFGK